MGFQAKRVWSLNAFGLQHTPSGQKYFNNVKYACTNCAIYRLNIELQHKMAIDIY